MYYSTQNQSLHSTISLESSTCTNILDEPYRRWNVIKLALISRVILLLAMSLSCAILPDFNPGADVLQFDLRLSNNHRFSSTRHCFCLKGYACDPMVLTRRRVIVHDESELCADMDLRDFFQKNKTRYVWLDSLYNFILPPATKWDAARFLTLSVDPWARYPSFYPMTENFLNDTVENFDRNDGECNLSSVLMPQCQPRFDSSEQSHAFMPLYPLCIRYVTWFLMRVIPSNIIPLTYEALAALCAILFNMIMFLISAVALYDLTFYMLMGELLVTSSRQKITEKDWFIISNTNEHQLCYLLSNTSACLFCFNPAGVFFTAAYSESLFSMLTFTGHSIAARGRYFNCKNIKHRQKLKIDDVQHVMWSKFYWIPTTVLWMLASYTRSNGTLSSVWWILTGLGNCCSIIGCNREDECKLFRQSHGRVLFAAFTLVKIMLILFWHCMLSFLIVIPNLYHDAQGYNIHCLNSTILHSQTKESPLISPFLQLPEWCRYEGHQSFSFSTFSLYAFVQRKHWNVGLFRYFQFKQIPNHVIATPVLTISASAVVLWIHMSWNCFIQTTKNGKKALPFERFFKWAFFAMSSSSNCTTQRSIREPGNQMVENLVNTIKGQEYWLLGSTFLSYYATLCGFVLIGTFLAHVQISTRLICSSCPGFYWFVCFLVVRYSYNIESDHLKRMCGHFNVVYLIPRLLFLYFTLYNLLGAIMHVNWLPWT